MKLTAQKRPGGDAGSLRRAGRLPAIVYNRELSVPVSVDLREFDKVFRSQGTSHVIDLEIDGEVREVLVKEVQMNKRRRVPQHIDFYAVTAGQLVDVHVHLELQGTPVGVRDGGMLDIQRREVHISILPRYIPEHVTVDISGLQMGHSLHVRDIIPSLPAQAKVLDDLDITVAAVVAPRVAEDAEGTGAAEPEVIGKGAEEDE